MTEKPDVTDADWRARLTQLEDEVRLGDRLAELLGAIRPDGGG
jgi:hypothetical protein